MSTAELKIKLKKKIEELHEDYLLEEILNIIDLETNSSKIIKIPEEHKKDLEISLGQMDAGDLINHDKVIQELKDGFAD